MTPHNTQAPPTFQAAFTLLADELQPALVDLTSLAKRAASLKIGVFKSFWPKDLDALEDSYANTMTRFMDAYHKWAFPDEMFRGRTDYDAQMLADYIKARPLLKEHINEGFRLLEYIDRTLGGHRSSARNRVAVILSLMAVVVSVVAL